MRDDIIEYANKLLDVHAFSDYGPMGAQYLGDEKVWGIVCGVSLCKDLILEAAKQMPMPSMIVVHHGMYWNNEPRLIDERTEQRLKLLEHFDYTLLAYHLSLDAHPDIGNNVMWVKRMGVKKPHSFGGLGWGGTLPQRITLNALIKKIGLTKDAIVYPYGPERVKRVCCITGSAAHYIFQAVEEGYHLFLTGEADEQTQALAKELKINFIAAGHHETEKIGIRALTALIGIEFNVLTKFIDVPNPV